MFKATFLLLLVILYGSSTSAQQGRDMEKEKAIWAELETFSPRSVPDFKAATEAMDAQDYNKAVELYQAVYQKAPHFDAVLRRLGGCLVLTGKPDSNRRAKVAGLCIDQRSQQCTPKIKRPRLPGAASATRDGAR